MPILFERLQSTGTILLASDGLLKYASAEQISATVLRNEFEVVPQKLVELARYPSGALPDDVSVIIAGDA